MVENIALRILAASTRARIHTLVILASLVKWAICVENTFWSTPWIRISLIFRQTCTYSPITLSVGAAGGWIARVCFVSYRCCKYKLLKNMHEQQRILDSEAKPRQSHGERSLLNFFYTRCHDQQWMVKDKLLEFFKSIFPECEFLWLCHWATLLDRSRSSVLTRWWFWITATERISGITLDTSAHWSMINHCALSTYTTRTWTRISALLSDASSTARTIRIYGTFRFAVWRTTNVSWQTRTWRRTSNISALCMWPTWGRCAWILNLNRSWWRCWNRLNDRIAS